MAKKGSKKGKKQSHSDSKKKKQTEEELIEEGLSAIYGEEKDVDFSKLDKGKGRLTNILLTVVLTLAFVAGVSWGAFFIYNKYFAESEYETFALEIDVRDELISGERTQIAINYQNPSAVPITALELDVRIPETFLIADLSPTPANEEDFIWTVGNLSAGSDGVIVIDGIWIAETPSSTPVQVLANYRPANFNSDFQDIETTYIQTLDSTFDITFNGPEEAIPGDELTYEIEVTNNSTQALENVEFSLELPDGFFLDSSDPEIEAGESPIWKFDLMESEATEMITIEGTFAADVTGFQYFETAVGIESGGRTLTQATEQGFTDVLGSDVTVQLIVNGGAEDMSTEIGEQLRVTLTYENTGESLIEAPSILLDFQSEDPIPISWDSAEIDGGSIAAEGIKWEGEVIPPLEPGERRLLNLLFPIGTVGSGQADKFTLVAQISHGDIEVKSSPINVTINSEAELSASARYFTDDGAPLGNGPLPPEVGKTTTYRIYWTITNSLHDLEDVSVVATLPPNVTWEAQPAAELGTINYDANEHTVTWSVSNLPTTIDRLQANFALSITPEEDQVGQFVKLTSDSILTATDFTTEARLETIAESLTSELLGDDFAEDKGVVIENTDPPEPEEE